MKLEDLKEEKPIAQSDGVDEVDFAKIPLDEAYKYLNVSAGGIQQLCASGRLHAGRDWECQAARLLSAHAAHPVMCTHLSLPATRMRSVPHTA